MDHDLPGQDDSLLESLRSLDAACGEGTSKHDRAVVLIHACIDSGCNTKEGIFGMLQRMGWNMRHAGIILAKSTGSNPSRHYWQRDEAGIYRSHP